MSGVTENMTVATLKAALREAKEAAFEAADHFFKNELGGEDKFACGFAWVDIHGIKGNTKLGRSMKEAGFKKSYTGSYQVWNPSEYGCQNVDTLEAGARAAADVFKKYGLRAYAGSRLD